MPSKWAALVALVFLVGVWGPAHARPEGCAGLPQDVAQALVGATNRARAASGLPGLAANPALDEAAHLHACEMRHEGFFAHEGPSGLPGERARASGYGGCRVLENIAQGQPQAGVAFAGWLARPGHRANILDAQASDVGFGMAQGGRGFGGPRWVMLVGDRCAGRAGP